MYCDVNSSIDDVGGHEERDLGINGLIALCTSLNTPPLKIHLLEVF